MSEPKFTPGPWVAENHKGDWWVFGEGGEVATVLPWSTDADQADAHLIAAAPDMYEALKWQARNCPLCLGTTRAIHGIDVIKGDDTEKDCERCAPARAALAKAEGKT